MATLMIPTCVKETSLRTMKSSYTIFRD
jgi:hypothetical protein